MNRAPVKRKPLTGHGIFLIFRVTFSREDDDINDVAAMGGVNLNEENARILASQVNLRGQVLL